MTALRPALALAAALLVAVVTGCASSTPAASPTPTPDVTTPVPTPSTVDPEPEATAMLLSGAGFTLVDGEGVVLFEQGWTGQIAEVRDELTAVFGEPTATEYPQSEIRGPYLELEWAGLTFAASAPWDETLESDLSFYVVVQQSQVSGVAVSTASGASVGMTADEVVDLGARPTPEISYAIDAVDPAVLEAGKFDAGEYTEIVMVVVGSDGIASQLQAPMGTSGNL